MPTTIIDFSPQALEIDEVAEAAGTIDPNIPPPAIPTINISATVNRSRPVGENFAANAPDILFVAEYALPGQESQGALVVWENYYNATHYEVFKRVYTAQDDAWKRIFIIDSGHLATETAQYKPYIENRLGLNIDIGYYAILDTDVAVDQIVEYKVAAGNYPNSADLDFEILLRSQGQLSTVPVNSTDKLTDFSNRVFGSPDYGWLIALLNPGAQYFGKKAAMTPLSQFIGPTAYVPNDLSFIPRALQESIYYFGLKATFTNLFNYTRDTVDVIGTTDFFQLVVDSIDESKNALSYSVLQQKLQQAYPRYADYMTQLRNGKLPNSPLDIPNYSDDNRFNSLSDFTYTFLRVNTMLVGVLYANDNDLKVVLQSILQNLGSNKPAPITNPILKLPGILGKLK